MRCLRRVVAGRGGLRAGCGGLLAARRWTGSSSSSSSSNANSSATQKAAPMSAVNVESFTLNEDVVRRDLADLARWNALAEQLEGARAAHNHRDIIAHVQRGLALLHELGADHAPIQCASLLHLEAAQAHYNLAQYAEAMTHARLALRELQPDDAKDTSPASCDLAQVNEIKQLMGFICCRQRGQAREAERIFTEVLHWIDVESRGAMPMQAVAAINQRRAVLTGLAQSLVQQAAGEDDQAAGEAAHRASGGRDLTAVRELYGRALDLFIEALDKHVDEKDSAMVKTSLEGILTCFEGIGDLAQAKTTCEKYIRWCQRQEDADGVAYGTALRDALCQRHHLPVESCETAGDGGKSSSDGTDTSAAGRV